MATRYRRAFLGVPLLVASIAWSVPTARADNKRLNDGVAQNVYTIQHQAGCTTNHRRAGRRTRLSVNPKTTTCGAMAHRPCAQQWKPRRRSRFRRFHTPRSGQCGRFSRQGSRDGCHQSGIGHQRHRTHQSVVLPPRLPGDHAGLRQHRDRRLVGEQSGPHRSGRGLRPTGLISSARRDVATDDLLHDLGRSAVDRLYPGVDESTRNRILRHVAVAAVQLQAPIHHALL
jgi:hypothetical protein